MFFPPSDEYDQDGDGVPDMGGEIDTNNLVQSFAVYGGEFRLDVLALPSASLGKSLTPRSTTMIPRGVFDAAGGRAGDRLHRRPVGEEAGACTLAISDG